MISAFPQFSSFPAEIQGLVMEACQPNDLICLRLTCKTLYYSSPIKQIHKLSTFEQEPFCIHNPTDSKDTLPPLQFSQRYSHRQTCHDRSFAFRRIQAENGLCKRPRDISQCKTGWRSDHCECWSQRSRLHNRLRSWMPSKLKYCGECGMFTKRKRCHNGRCYHGRPKPRKRTGNFWTHRSRRGAFGHKLWKMWFNNAAMNKLESRLRTTGGRKVVENGRYGLRALGPVEVDTSRGRDSDRNWDWRS
ncbi:hypothetical protein BJ875DRAFT_386669 [Amylocarpus encephaloides]|uniref:F-box domain-containing protein n=1 Tax=Amylocarpus encephaloides TaxID=45428 RepID=A0A9P7Y9D2_9HELO|nr:hypothetical protein BJ875DRAFT_386669 [Amylocarpus encephaloides]